MVKLFSETLKMSVVDAEWLPNTRRVCESQQEENLSLTIIWSSSEVEWWALDPRGAGSILGFLQASPLNDL